MRQKPGGSTQALLRDRVTLPGWLHSQQITPVFSSLPVVTQLWAWRVCCIFFNFSCHSLLFSFDIPRSWAIRGCYTTCCGAYVEFSEIYPLKEISEAMYVGIRVESGSVASDPACPLGFSAGTVTGLCWCLCSSDWLCLSVLTSFQFSSLPFICTLLRHGCLLVCHCQDKIISRII